ncbi:uncharacterized protein LOC122088953 [Macadamia integrifolia]|uniref:uncharacterized protein LOC122088953 n=1 Tax=Macadamia integrifolia TaxID=60698 RepID=UPI001C4FBD83|nr:uncharacterized protein LOC122088953 [Macadamia integrifolia]
MELLQVIPNEVNREDSSILEAIPAREEIKKVVWGLDPDSSPGPDGFPGAFFKQCWEIVGDDFCGAVIAFFHCGKLPNGVNNSFVTLIPKVEGAVSLDKFRPICMANFFCKVLSKIMAERLSCLLPRLVSDEGGGMGIKIDVQKAYDTLSWDFLFAVLKRFGFSDVWGLNGLLKEGKLKALPGPRGATVPSHLLFADDIFIFMNAGAKHVRCLREFLLKYREFSGKKFSLEKSKGWQGKLLSMAGCAELIRSMISGMPIHNFSIYWWPESVIKTVERWIRNFPWSGDIYTVKKIAVKWEEVCRPKEEGGLGIRRLRDVNCAVLSKLVWQMKHEGSAFSSFLRARFVNEGGDLKKGYKASSVFKGIAKMLNFESLSERWMGIYPCRGVRKTDAAGLYPP